ncbi:MAG: hypothetical protein C5B49_01485 [Bdellovibrio sp.]|nr:MAG: hypothetical protein C5B49_01485 [Bdellovibrio sp.]
MYGTGDGSPSKTKDRRDAEQILEKTLLPQLVSSASSPFNIGPYKDLQRLMVEAGTAPERASIISLLIRKIAIESKGNDSILGLASAYLESATTDEKTLMICVLSRNCQFRNLSNTIHEVGFRTIVDPGFRIDPIPANSENSGWAKRDSNGRTDRPPYFLLLKDSQIDSFQTAVGAFFNQAARFVDLALIRDFLTNNPSALLEIPVFSEYMRLGADGKPEVDESFVRVVLALRGYKAQWDASHAVDRILNEFLEKSAESSGLERKGTEPVKDPDSRFALNGAMAEIQRFRPQTLLVLKDLTGDFYLSQQAFLQFAETYGRVLDVAAEKVRRRLRR